MSRTVDSRAVEMQFDNSDFESNVKQSISTLDKLKRALKLDGASAGLQEVERSSGKLKFDGLKGSITSVGKKFGVLETIATGALLKIGMSAADAGMKLVKSLTIDQVADGWNKYAEKTTAVQTIMANLRDDEGQFVDEASKLEHVNKYLDKLLWFSDETSYSFTDMTSNVGKFIANGQGLEDSVTAMQGIASWAAVSGQNSQVAARAMYNISQAMGAGSMKIKDWMSIENANMATAQFKELAIAVGQKKGKIEEGQVTIENFRESLSGKDTKDWFDKDVMMEVFSTYGEAANRIQEYAEAHNVTSTEAIRKIKETDKDFADSIGFKAFAAAQEAKTFGEVVSATADAVSTKWMRIFENIFGNYLEAKELWTDLSEQMWEIFASPLDTMNEIMTSWNTGFFSGGREEATFLEQLVGYTKDFDQAGSLVSRDMAEMKVETDQAHYSIKKLSDGTEELVYTWESAGKTYQTFSRIVDGTGQLISGRTLLFEGLQNIFDTLVHDVEDENGKLESMSFFGSLKRGLQEVIFGTSEVDEIIPKVSQKIWSFTERFKELTERLKPSMETSLKIKNAFKGLFTLFKTGGKIVTAIGKPFKDLLGRVFKNPAKGILDLSDSVGTWIQKLHEFLEENKIFDKISEKVEKGLSVMKDGLDEVSLSLFGLTAEDLSKAIRDKVFGFFQDFNFQEKYDQITAFFSNIGQQIRQVKTGELPEKLTPLQTFLVTAKTILDGIKSLASSVKERIFGPGPLFTSIVEQIKQVKSGDLPETLTPFQKFLIIGGKVFDGIKTLFSFVSKVVGGFIKSTTTLLQTGDIKEFFGSLIHIFSDAKTEFDKTGLVGTLLDAFKSLNFNDLITSITDTISSVREGIEGSGLLGKFFEGLGKVFSSATDFLASVFNGKGLLGFLKTAAKIAIVAKLISFVKSLISGAKILDKVGGLIDSMKGSFDSITGFFKAKKNESLAKAALSFGASVLMLAFSVSILGKMNPEELYRGIVAIGLLVLVFTLFKKLNDNSDSVKKASNTGLLAFAIAIAILTRCIKTLGELDTQQIMNGIIAIGAMVLIFSLLTKLNEMRVGIGDSAKGFLVFSVAILILAKGVKTLGELELSQIFNGIIAIGAMVIIFSLLTKLNEMRTGIGQSTRGFLVFGIAIAILSIGVRKLGELELGQVFNGIIAIGAMVLLFSLLTKLNEMTVGIGSSTKGFLVFGIAIAVLSIGVRKLGELELGQVFKGVIAVGAMVLIFSLLTKLNEMRTGMGKSVGAFLLFGIAVDLMSIGIKAIGELDVSAVYTAITAIGAMVVLFAVFNNIAGESSNFSSIGSLLAFSFLIIALSAGLKAMIPVMQQIQAMGDDWWKPLVYMAAAIGLLLAAGAIAGIGIVTAGLMALSIVAVAIGAACLLAGIGINLVAKGIAVLAEAIAKHGGEAAKNIAAFIDSMLDAIIASGPKLALAGATAIIALAYAIASSAGYLVSAAIIIVVQFVLSLLSTLISLIPSLVEGIVSAINAMAEAIRMMAKPLTKAMLGLLEALIEAVLIGIATIVKPWGGVGAAISDKIMKWIPGIKDAFGVAADEAEASGEQTAESYVDGFNGVDAGKSLDVPTPGADQTSSGIDMNSIMSNIPGMGGENGVDISQYMKFDMSGLQSMLGDGIAGIDMSGIMGNKMGELSTSIEDSTPKVAEASKSTAAAIEEPITKLDSHKWGTDIGLNLSHGLKSVIPTVETTASEMAAAIAKYVHFSEPDEGALSKFHTFAPDMVKLWCKGIKDNLGYVKASSEEVADTVYDGFSTALDYVSELINNGMSDELTIRPVMDLTEIQNGVNSINGMMSSANGYEIAGTARLAASTAYSMRPVADASQIEQLPGQTDIGPTSNTFYITSNDPNAVAEKVSKILSSQTRRQKAVWAR